MTSERAAPNGPPVLIDPREFSPTFLEALAYDYRHFVVLLFRVAPRSKPQYVGSGTLVTCDGEHCILTAAHVWAALHRVPDVAISHTSDWNIDVVRADLFRVFVPQPRTADEWGPDLALMRVPDHLLPKLKAEKAFHDLHKVLERCQHEPLHPNRGFWFFLGAPAELGVFDEDVAILKIMAYGGAGPELHEIHRREQYDYYDLRVNRREINGLPESHGGVSGGGLWRVAIERDADGSFRWLGQRRFEGVVFYEWNPAGEVGFVRAHGRESIRTVVRAFRAAGWHPKTT
jgi:hypothetical protein